MTNTTLNTKENNLRQQKILVTGPENEIGYHVSQFLASQGAELIWLARKAKYLHQLYDDIVSKGYPEPLIIEFDRYTASDEGFDILSSHLQQHIRSLQGVIHCELNVHPLTPVLNTTIEQWQASYRDYLFIPQALTKATLPLLKQSSAEEKNASTIFITLQAAREAQPYWSCVGSAYAALENFKQTLCSEFSGTNMRFNSIEIDSVNTAQRQHFFPAENPASLLSPTNPKLLNLFAQLLTNKEINNQVFIPGQQP